MMTEFNIDQQQARIIQQADSIINNPVEERRDHARIATDALQAQHYSIAAKHYIAALEFQPGDPDLHYGLALALLNGIRPSRHTRNSIIEIQRHLNEARALPEAQVLSVLVSEDYGLFWQKYSDVPDGLRDLIDRTSRGRAAEIVFHVPAREARTWQELAAQRLPERLERKNGGR